MFDRIPIDLNKSTCHSGGARGSDSYFEDISNTYGAKTKAYSYKTKHHLSHNKVEISDSDYNEGVLEIKKSNKILKRFGIDKYMNLLARNWPQIKYSSEVFAIGSIIKPNEKDSKGYINNSSIDIVSGGTGYATTMAILNKKELYVFDQNIDKWFKWSYISNKFIPTQDVYISKLNFTGIGTRDINDCGIRAIIKLLQNTETKFNSLPLNLI